MIVSLTRRTPTYLLLQPDGLYTVKAQKLSRLNPYDISSLSSRFITVVVNTSDAQCSLHTIPKLTPYELVLFKKQLSTGLSPYENKYLHPARRPTSVIQSHVPLGSHTASALKVLQDAGVIIETILYAHQFDVQQVSPDQTVLFVTRINQDYCRCSFIDRGQLIMSEVLKEPAHAHQDVIQRTLCRLEHAKSIRTDRVITTYKNKDFYDHPHVSNQLRTIRQQSVSGISAQGSFAKQIRYILSWLNQMTKRKDSLIMRGLFVFTFCLIALKYGQYYQSEQLLTEQKISAAAYLNRIGSSLSLEQSLFILEHQQRPFALFATLVPLTPYVTFNNMEWRHMNGTSFLSVTMQWEHQEKKELIQKMIDQNPHLEINYKHQTTTLGNLIIRVPMEKQT